MRMNTEVFYINVRYIGDSIGRLMFVNAFTINIIIVNMLLLPLNKCQYTMCQQ